MSAGLPVPDRAPRSRSHGEGWAMWWPSELAIGTGSAWLALALLGIWWAVWSSLVHRSHALWIHLCFLALGPLLLGASWWAWRGSARRLRRPALVRRFAFVPVAIACIAVEEIAVAALGGEARFTCLAVFLAASAAGTLVGEIRQATTRRVRWLPLTIAVGYATLSLIVFQTVFTPANWPLAVKGARAATAPLAGRLDDLLPTPSGDPPRIFRYGIRRDVDRTADATLDVLPSRTVDARSAIRGWTGFTGWLRSTYFGFGPEALPLAGKVWLPAVETPTGAGTHPLILVVHGNHPMEEPSFEGFGYLCDTLARQGHVCVSIDQTFLNTSYLGDLFGGLQGDRLVRSWMILEHLALIRAWNDSPGNPLHGLVDLDEIGLVGHSRGGAAVVMAADLNGRDDVPVPLDAALPTRFGIRSVTGLAPIEILPDDRLGDGRLALDGISYLVLHGSHDTDIHSFEGSLQYGRMRPGAGRDVVKASFHFAGGNHSQFNTAWGANDKPLLLAPLVDQRTVISAEEQRALTRLTLTRFLGAVHRRSEADRAWLRDPSQLAVRLGEGRLAHRYRDARTVELAGFDEDRHPSTATIQGGVVATENFDLAREERIERRWIGSLEVSHSLRLAWAARSDPAPPRVSVVLPDRPLMLRDGDELLLDLALDVHDPDAPRSLTFDVELVDEGGRLARTTLRDRVVQLGVGLAPLYHAHLLNPRSEILPTTLSLRLGDFEAVDPLFDSTGLREIRLVFDGRQAGSLFIDGIAARHAL